MGRLNRKVATMEIEKHELRKMLKEAAAEGARFILSQLKNPKIKEFVSERTAFEMLAKAGITDATLNSWVNQGKIKFHRSGVS